MNAITSNRVAAPDKSEARMVAREMATAYRSSVEYHKKTLNVPAHEAVAKAEEPCSLDREWRILDCPAEEVSWADLEELARKRPERALLRWEEVKQAAREELQCGHRAAQAVEGYGSSVWQRAEFLAIREELAQEWQPRNGIERQLIDTMAQAQTAMLFWQKLLMLRASVEPMRDGRNLNEHGAWAPPCVSDHQALEQAGAMVERFNRMFLRALRVLRDLRRHSTPVVVRKAGQVNVGRQQVNVWAKGS